MKKTPATTILGLVVLALALFTLGKCLISPSERGSDDMFASIPDASGDPVVVIDDRDEVSSKIDPMPLRREIRISGRIVSPEGEAVAGINVHLYTVHEGLELIATSNSEGAFGVRRLGDQSTTTLLFEGKGWLPQFREISFQGDRDYDLGWITIEAAGLLCLSVTHADGLVLNTFDVELIGRDKKRWSTDIKPHGIPLVDLRDVFQPCVIHTLESPVLLEGGSLLCSVPVGSWYVRVRTTDGVAGESECVEFNQHGLSNVIIELGETKTISGICVGTDGIPIPGVRMDAYPQRIKNNEGDRCEPYDLSYGIRLSNDGCSAIAEYQDAETDRFGEFVLSPIPLGSTYRVDLHSDVHMVIIEPADWQATVVSAGTRDLRFVLEEQPQLHLTVLGKAYDIGPGPGTATVLYERRRRNSVGGSSGYIPYDLQDRTTIIPLHHQHPLEGDEEGHVTAWVCWGGRYLGQGSALLPDGMQDVHITVEVSPGFVHAVGLVPFQPAEFVEYSMDRDGQFRTHDRLIEEIPAWLFGDSTCLIDGATGGTYRLVSGDRRSRYVGLWSEGFRQLIIAYFEQPGTDSDPLRQQAYTDTGTICIHLEEDSNLDVGEELSGSVIAYVPTPDGSKRIKGWSFGMSPVHGQRPRYNYLSRQYEYKRAPDATVTMERPSNLEYVVNIFRDNRKVRGQPTLTRRFTLKDTETIHVYVP